MSSPFRDRFRQFDIDNGARADGLEARTGINLERDVDSVLVASTGRNQAPTPSDRAVLIARGRFDAVRIEGLMRQQGAQVDQYRGKRVVSIKDASNDTALTFAEPGLLLFGPGEGVRAALDAKAGAAQGISANGEFMALVNDVD